MRSSPIIRQKHKIYYFSLILLLSIGLFATLAASGNSFMQSLILLFMTLCYVGIGLGHHYIDHNLTTKIVVEYVLMGALGMSLIVLVFK